MQKTILGFIFLAIVAASCRPPNPTPKPRGYFRIDFPNRGYQNFDSAGFPFIFKYPVYAKITQDSNLIKQAGEPYWINIYVPAFDATIYLSYKEINHNETVDQLVDESFRLTNAHNVKADYIRSPIINTPLGYSGIFYTVGGNAASAYQFFVTDDTQNFIRGSLYFNIAPNADSLAPMYEFLKQDIDTLISSLKFR